jgi:hypothetical protein
MPENDAGTPNADAQAQAGAAATAAATTGTAGAPDEVTTLRSRNAGLDAKVTSLTKLQSEAVARAEAAEARALELAAGKDNGDKELRAQLEALQKENATAKRDALLARIEGKYPETFAVLGEAAANLSADKLAEAEARFKGVAEPAAPGRPIGNNPPRTQGPTGGPSTGTETLAQMRARVFAMDPTAG